MRSGAMRHLVRIQALVTTMEAEGGHTERWTDWRTVRARITRLSPGMRDESVAADALRVLSGYRIDIRKVWQATIRPDTHRIVLDSRVLDIIAVDDLTTPGEVTMFCQEGLTNG